MMTPDEIKNILLQKLAGAEVEVEDMTGTFDHFQVQVAWKEFLGKPLIKQHKIVHDALLDALEDGRIHALKIKTEAK